MSSRTRVGLALLGVALSVGLLWAFVVPPWQAPDEWRHFEYVKLILEEGRLVSSRDISPEIMREIIDSMVRHNYWQFGYAYYPYDPSNPPQSFEEIVPDWIAHSLYHPPAYYAAAALFISPLSRSGVDQQLLAARVFSVLLGALSVAIAYGTARAIFPQEEALSRLAPLIVALLPMHAFINASVNSDALAELMVSLLIFQWVVILRRGLSPLLAIGVVFATVVGFLTKRITVMSLPISAVGLLLWLTGKPWRSLSTGKLAAVGMGLILGMAGMAALLTWRDEICGFMPGACQFVLRYPRYLVIPEDIGTFILNPGYYTAEAFRTYFFWAQTLFESFWARFGWMNVRPDPYLYWLLGGFTLASGFGLIHFLVRHALRGDLEASQWRSIIFLLLTFPLALVVIFFGHLRSVELYPIGPPQGRFLLPVVVPIALMLAMAAQGLWPKVGDRRLTLGYGVGFLFLNLFCLARYILPFYYR
ncbi:MAG TPA: hypothetical protein DCP08_02730 [Chloroflexi bacterium]|nr:hypothetical protein [Chloroflexota bacterium]